ncbi:MAG: arsenate reductase (azurin) small subunit [Acidobacteria bacterium]|nr:arsenate reductase (azurin) small subunit [Acidobacteriota bacterium]
MTKLTRREFVLIGTAIGAGAAVGVILPLSRQPDGETAGSTTTTVALPAAVVGLFPRIRVASVGDVNATTPISFDYPLQGQSNVMVKLDQPVAGEVGPDEDIVAFSSLCTHMGCVVSEYRPEHKALGPCPCHFSTFDLAHNGMVTLGQATQNLPQVLLSVEGDDIYATGVLRLVYGYANTLQGGRLVEMGS